MLGNAALKGRLVLLAGGAAAALGTAVALRADLMVNHGFAIAFGGQAPLGSSSSTKVQGVEQVGDEGYWLTRAEVESPAPFDKRLSVGDRITITGRDGRERNLEVVDLRVIGEPLIQTVAGGTSTRLLLVTCRIVGGGSEQDAKVPVRFIIEGDPPVSAPPRQAAPKA
jgi:hypothetical protein